MTKAAGYSLAIPALNCAFEGYSVFTIFRLTDADHVVNSAQLKN